MLQLRHPARQGPQCCLQHRQRRGGASPSIAGIPRLQAGEDVKLYPLVARPVQPFREQSPPTAAVVRFWHPLPLSNIPMWVYFQPATAVPRPCFIAKPPPATPRTIASRSFPLPPSSARHVSGPGRRNARTEIPRPGRPHPHAECGLSRFHKVILAGTRSDSRRLNMYEM